MFKLNINNETGTLEAVVVGTAESLGGTPKAEDAYDPKSLEHIRAGTYPIEDDLVKELDYLATLLEEEGVEVFRPTIIRDYNQIFSRDKGFVIGDYFIVSSIINKRSREIEGIYDLMQSFNPSKILKPQLPVRIEGGDIMPWNNEIFIGYTSYPEFDQYLVARTNDEGVSFIREQFPDKNVKAFELIKSDDDPRANALHLDCCFQPIGNNEAIMCPEGFKNQEDIDFLIDYFGDDHIIKVSLKEMYEMNCNIFSLSPDTIITDESFVRLNRELTKRGYRLIEIPYSETAKLGGLLRCSTLPLRRQ